MRKTAIIFFLLVLFGCQSTTVERTGIPYDKITAKSVDDAVAEDNLLQALWFCELYSRQEHIENRDLFLEKREQIIKLIRSRLAEPENNDPDLMLKMYDSLKNLGLDVPEADYSDLLASYTEKLTSENEHLSEWYKLSEKSASPAPDSGKAEKIVWDDIIKSTVTVYLDRGIKIEGGYGYKDMALGSGFFVSDDGYIVTNYHVIESHVDPSYEGYSRVYIKLEDFKSPKIPAKVVGWDPLFDLALLKAEIDSPMTIPLVPAKELKAGDRIYAIGSPGGLEKTLTSGIVSSPERPLLELGQVLQVDVPINHGNSGGPLLNENGQLVGVVFAGVETFEGINFAIPGKYLFNNLYKMAEGGVVKYPFMGFIATEHKPAGIEVIYVFPHSPSAQAGLKTGDIITTINGKEITDMDMFTGLIDSFRIDSLLSLGLTREEKQKQIVLKCSKRDDDPLEYALNNDVIQNVLFPVFGMKLDMVAKGPFSSKFTITRILPGSAAEENGLSVNDTVKLYKYKYLPEQNAIILDVSIRKKTSGFLDIKMQIGAYLYASGIF